MKAKAAFSKHGSSPSVSRLPPVCGGAILPVLFTVLVLFSLTLLASGAVLTVGPGGDFTELQPALDAAQPGDEILLAPGTYPENAVVSTSPLTIRGARQGVSGVDRVPGAPDPLLETILTPAAGRALSIESAAGPVVVDGLVLQSPTTDGVISHTGPLATGTIIRNCVVRVAPGGTGSALHLHGPAPEVTLHASEWRAAAGGGPAVHLAATGAFPGWEISGNAVLRDGPAAGTGLQIEGNRSFLPSLAREALISGNRFEGHAVGLHAGSRALDTVNLTGNLFTGNEEGFAGGPADSVFTANTFTGNTTSGLRLTAFGQTDPSHGAITNSVTDNEFATNGTTAPPGTGGDLVVDDQPAGHADGQVLKRNSFTSTTGIRQGDPGGTLDASFNYWGDSSGPGGLAPGTGASILGPGTTSWIPWLSDTHLTTLTWNGAPVTGTVTLDNNETVDDPTLALAAGASLIIGDGARVQTGLLTIPAGAEVRVDGGTLVAGEVDLQSGGILDVVDGVLEFEPLGVSGTHQLEGTFTFFDSLGSLSINGNTSFSGTSFGLVADLHVANGVNLTVEGSLTLDGCRIDSPGSFNLIANAGAELALVRSLVDGAAILLAGSDVLLRDNILRNSTITVLSTVAGAEIYHNVFEDGPGTLTVLSGATVTTTREGWGNVGTRAATQNDVHLAFAPPADPTRTLDGNGNLFVQPGDPVHAILGVSSLVDKAQALETLAGYNTTFLTLDQLSPDTGWDNLLYEADNPTATIGRINSAIGLAFSHPDPEGTLADSPVADCAWTANALEGITTVFLRSRDGADHPLIDNRLTVTGTSGPEFRSYPFTANAGELTIDGTPPEFGPGPAVGQVQGSTTVDPLLTGVLTLQGIVTVTFPGRDLLAGIDNVDATVAFRGPSGDQFGTLVSTAPTTLAGEDYTLYTFEWTVDATTPNGLYDVDAVLMDRSGNESLLPLGALEVAKNQIATEVATQGLVSTALTRDVTFTASDAGGSPLATWTVPVDFLGGVGSALLEAVPNGTANLSAKTAWNLRVRLPAVLDPNGQAAVSFTGPATLPGGDFTGDNLVNLSDYNILRANFLSVGSVADVTGDGIINLTDFNLVRFNWFTIGDPE